MNYELKRISPEIPRRIAQRYKTDLLSATILSRRGISERQQLKYYLENSINYLLSPFLFEDMFSAVERVFEAIENNEKICIFGDRDADGITATALLYSELTRLGAEVSYMLPQNDDPYGLTLKNVEELKDNDVNLVITVDCGISCNKEVDKLNEYGIDTIITDHHLSGDELPNAFAIIDPKASNSTYPFIDLAGCGVASKLVWALRFKSSRFFGSDLILLHCLPGPGKDTTTIIQAVRLENLVEKERVIEELPNGAFDYTKSRIVSLLTKQLPIFVYDKDVELRALKLAFGRSADISLYDVKDDIAKVMPFVKNMSLFDLSKKSRAALYSDGSDELDTLISLFISSAYYSDPLLTSEYEKLLDLVAIGTVADLMPLKGENRIIVKLGLKQLNNTPRQALISLLSAQNLLQKPISSTDIGWYISPVINSAGRLGCPDIALKLLLCTDPIESDNLTKELIKLNKERQKLSEDAYISIKDKARESLESFGSKFILVKDESIPRGLTGSICTKVLKDYPALNAVMVVAKTDEKRLVGSIRSRGSFNCREFLSNFDSHLIDFGGHKAAGGFSIDEDQFYSFEKALDEAVLALDEDEKSEDIVVDAIIPPAYMSSDLIKIVELFEPYGEQNPMLNFLAESAEITDCISLGENKELGNLRLSLKIGSSIWPCLYWNSRDAFKKNFDIGDRVKLIFRMSRNYFRGSSNLQLTVVALERI